MQDPLSRTNRQRTEATRALLLSAARKLFTERSYADTGTPEIVAAAGVTRGALYHHFADKQALFRAVVEQEAAAVAAEVEAASSAPGAALDLLLAGGRAYLLAMARPGRTRLLLLDGPSVLGRAEMDRIDGENGSRTLREGLAVAMREGEIERLPLDALTTLLGAMFDRAALSVEDGMSLEDQMKVISAVIRGVTRE